MKTFLKTTVLWLMAVVIFTAGSTIGLAFTVNGHIECEETGMVPYGALVKVFEVDPVAGGGYTAEEILLTSPAVVDENGDFTVTSTVPLGGIGFETGNPDFFFLFSQNINSCIETIYAEDASQTHWNVPDGHSLTFEISSDLAVWVTPGITYTGVPNNNLFVFTRVGICETADIDCRGDLTSSEGYYKPRKIGYGFIGMDTDKPFGRTLNLFGWFGGLVNIAYYKVQYSTDNSSTWTDISTSLPNKWFDTIGSNWVSQSMGPFSAGGVDNLYTIPHQVMPNTPWSFLDRVARFDTTQAADGPCRIRVIGYRWVAGTLVEASDPFIEINPAYGEIVLQIDNTPPTVQIIDLELNGVSTDVCQVLNFGSSSSDDIEVEFRVWDQRGHLRAYTVEAMYGHDCRVSPRPPGAADNYDNNSSGSPSWQGSMSYSTQYVGDIYPPPPSDPTLDCSSLTFAEMPLNVMPTCAYQFRLHVSKRTTNGYGLIYRWVEDTWHVTIER